MVKTTVIKKGQTVVPAEIHKEFQIKANLKLNLVSEGSAITVVPAPEIPIRTLRRFSVGTGLPKALLKVRKR